KVVKSLTVDDKEFHIAAGASKCVVATVTGGMMSRYDLATGAEEASVRLRDRKIEGLAMGCAAEGPLVAAESISEIRVPMLYDLGSLERAPAKAKGHSGDFGDVLRVSPDGKLIAGRRSNSWSGVFLTTVSGDELETVYRHELSGYVSPSPDARALFTM